VKKHITTDKYIDNVAPVSPVFGIIYRLKNGDKPSLKQIIDACKLDTFYFFSLNDDSNNVINDLVHTYLVYRELRRVNVPGGSEIAPVQFYQIADPQDYKFMTASLYTSLRKR
jgi:hypothetical protein